MRVEKKGSAEAARRSLPRQLKDTGGARLGAADRTQGGAVVESQEPAVDLGTGSLSLPTSGWILAEFIWECPQGNFDLHNSSGETTESPEESVTNK